VPWFAQYQDNATLHHQPTATSRTASLCLIAGLLAALGIDAACDIQLPSFDDPLDVAAGGTPYAAIKALQRAIVAIINCRVSLGEQLLDSAAQAASESIVHTVLAGRSANASIDDTIAAMMQCMAGAGAPGVSGGNRMQQIVTQLSRLAPELTSLRADSAITEARLAAERCMGCVTPQLLQQLLLVLLEVSSAGQTTAELGQSNNFSKEQ
jgi:hypothetical protein